MAREGWFKVDGDVKVDRLIARSGDSLVREGGEEARGREGARWRGGCKGRGRRKR